MFLAVTTTEKLVPWFVEMGALISQCGAAAATARLGVVDAVFVESVTSLTVRVCVLLDAKVAEKAPVPDVRAKLAGKVAIVSVDVTATLSVTLTTFQWASTALTRAATGTLTRVSWGGSSSFPVALPGSASSPG